MSTYSLKKYIKKISLFALAVTLSITSIPVSALEEADYISQGVSYYGQEEAVCSGSFVAGSSVSGTDNRAKIWNYLVQKGLSGQQAAGIMGNMQEESGFNPAREQDGSGTGWGLVQWDKDRRTAVRNYIASKDPSLAKYEAEFDKYGGATSASTGYVHKDIPVEDNDKLIALQLEFLYEEAITRKVFVQKKFPEQRRIAAKYTGKIEWEALKAAPNIKDASNIWLFSFERPGNQSDDHAAKRAGYGQAIFDELNRGGSGVAEDSLAEGEVGTVTGPCGTLPNSQGFEGKVVDYVISDWHAKPWWGASKAKPAYVAAADKAVKDGRYVGNGASKWYADCGGFVTTLLIDSGFEPSYNYSSKLKNGAGNTVQQRKWLEDNWQNLGRGGSVDTATLRAGDVFIKEGHTFIYIGDVPGINSKIASASNMERVPMAGAESITDSSGFWFRMKGGPASE